MAATARPRGPKLSILIPALDRLDQLEPTLVSVLANRPERCEIVVVLSADYDDPYQLEGEVRFLVAAECRTVVDALNAGLRACRGQVIHVLGCGAEVPDGWTAPIWDHFQDSRVAAVAPLVLGAKAAGRIRAAGLDYTLGGVRRELSSGQLHAAAPAEPLDVVAAPLVAGFYRAAYLVALGQAFSREFGDALADVELGLRLQRLGCRTVLEPRSLVFAPETTAAETTAFAAGRLSERFFWRQVEGRRRWGAVAAHLVLLAADALRACGSIRGLARFCGRLVGLLEPQRTVDSLEATPLDAPQPAPTPTALEGRRVDPPHADVPEPHQGAPTPKSASARRRAA